MKTRMRLGYAWPVLLAATMGCWSLKPAEDLPDVERRDAPDADVMDVRDADVMDVRDADVMDAPDADVMDASDVDVTDVVDADRTVDADVVDVVDADRAVDADVTDVVDVLDVVVCLSPLIACNDRCTDPRSDRENCGGCGRACAAGQSCCDGMCLDTQRDAMRCGSCTTVCSTPSRGTAACAGGVCGVGTCTTGWGDCDGNASNGCETNITTTVTDCGACGAACAFANAVPACIAGTCRMVTCVSGFNNCDGNDANGCEVANAALQTSVAHCGACGRGCGPSERCFSGTCVAQRSCAGTPTPPGCGLVTITSGSFTMGEAGALNGSPVQPNVTVGSFAIDAYEVTVARFNAYWSVRAAEMATVRASPIRYRGGMIAWQPAPNAEPYRQSSRYNWLPTSSPRDAHPMTGVDYWMAQEFCVWDGARLPTEAEWEYAARGSAGRVYPWGDTAPTTSCDRAQWYDCMGMDGASTRRVGSFPTGAAGGVFDLTGNVHEWLADNITPYSTGGAADPCANRSGTINPLCNNSTPDLRVIRGGSWGYRNVEAMRSASRFGDTPASRDFGIGFRCARDAP